MDFGDALKFCKDHGAKISRSDWGGKKGGSFVVYCAGYPEGVPANKNASESLGIQEGQVIYVDPYLVYCSSTGRQVPWDPTQYDLLADDWWVFS